MLFIFEKRLNHVFTESKSREIKLDNESKFIIFSDCHRGDNSWADDFAHNRNLLNHALYYYFHKGFSYIELGDGDELWKYKNFPTIRQAHSNTYQLMQLFHQQHRLYIIWGNHNRPWKNPNNVKKHLYYYFNERMGKNVPLFPKIEVYEGLILRYQETDHRILLTHGHQVDIQNDIFWWLFRFLTRNLWKSLQVFGIKDPTSPAQNMNVRQKVERRLLSWIKAHQQAIIAGHTHRPVFAAAGELPYFNTGSCVHPHCITGIELCNGEISLIKWFINIKDDGTLFIDKEILQGPVKLIKYFF